MKLNGEVIRIVRVNLGINQRKLALKAGVSNALIGHIERGERVLTEDVEQRIRNAMSLDNEGIRTIVEANRTITNSKTRH